MKTRGINEHTTLHRNLQNIILSYVDLPHQKPEISLKQGFEESYQKGRKTGLEAAHLSAFGPAFITGRLLDESETIKNPLVRVPAKLTTVGAGAGSIILGAVIAPVVGTAAGITKGVVSFSIFGGKKSVQAIKNAITADPAKKAIDDMSYFVDPENLLKKITS